MISSKSSSVSQGNRIIENSFPIDGISEMGAKERYLHGKTAHSLFIWWARRPFTAMRPVILTSLLTQKKNENTEIIKLATDLSSEVIPSEKSIRKTKQLLKNEYGRSPRILDIFGGGGTIALEAGRLGCEAYSIDVNPLAHFIQKALLEMSQTQKDLPVIIQKYGKILLDKLKIETNDLYKRKKSDPSTRNIAFLWTRTIQCSSCNRSISLSGDWWVSKKAKNKVLLNVTIDKISNTYTHKILNNPPDDLKIEKWKSTKGIVCPFCGKIYSKREFQSLIQSQGLQDKLQCVRQAQETATRLKNTANTSKRYILPEPISQFYPSKEEIENTITSDLKEIGQDIPNCKMPCWSGIVNPTLYGAITYKDLFNPRQLAVLLKLIKGLRNIREDLKRDGYSRQEIVIISSFLTAFIDQLVDWNCRLSMWIEENQQVGRALSGPGIPMLWRYSEIDPFLDGPANLYEKLNRMIKALKFIPIFDAPACAYLGSATKLPFNNDFIDAIITDPAYGDNLFYSALSECIYTWKRMVLIDLLPEIYKDMHVPFEEEIVAPIYKMDFKAAMKNYENGLIAALNEAHRVLTPDGVVSLFFSHGTKEAWALIVNVFKQAGFSIVRFWPISVERHQRPRGINSNAINVSVVIVARKSSSQKIKCKWEDIEKEIVTIASIRKLELKPNKWTEEDIALSCFIEAVGVVARHDKISDGNQILTLDTCIDRCLQTVEKSFPALLMKTRGNGKKK